MSQSNSPLDEGVCYNWHFWVNPLWKHSLQNFFRVTLLSTFSHYSQQKFEWRKSRCFYQIQCLKPIPFWFHSSCTLSINSNKSKCPKNLVFSPKVSMYSVKFTEVQVNLYFWSHAPRSFYWLSYIRNISFLVESGITCINLYGLPVKPMQ